MKKIKKRVFYTVWWDGNRCHVEAYIRDHGWGKHVCHESLLLAYGSRRDCERSTKEIAKESLFNYITKYYCYEDELELV